MSKIGSNSKIFDTLRDTDNGEPLHISKEECIELVEILTMVGAVLESGKLWFNSPDDPINPHASEFCQKLAKRFANITIEQEQ
jgi:hypothetical protein